MKEFFLSCTRGSRDIGISKTSVVIAYYVLLSLFPLLISVGAILPYFNIAPEAIDPYLDNIVPKAILDALRPGINIMLTTHNGGLLSLGIIGTMWSAGKGMHYIREGISSAYGLKPRNFLAARITSAGTLILLVFTLALMLLVFSFGEMLMSEIAGALGHSWMIGQYFRTLKWPVTFAVLFTLMLLIYVLTPNIVLRLRDACAGALTATLGMLTLTALFSAYLNIFVNTITAYGVIGAIFMLIMWLRALGYLLLLGAVINAVLFERSGRPLKRKHCAISRAIERIRVRLIRRARSTWDGILARFTKDKSE